MHACLWFGKCVCVNVGVWGSVGQKRAKLHIAGPNRAVFCLIRMRDVAIW